MSRERLTNYELVTVAVHLVGGIEGPVHIEHIAAKAFDLAPARFSWSLPEYRDYPDKDLVRVSLFDAQKVTNGEMVQSNKDKRGNLYWNLTSAGVDFCINRGLNLVQAAEQEGGGSQRRKHRQLLNQVRTSRLWNKHRQQALDDASAVLLTELLRVPPDSPDQVISSSFKALYRQVLTTRDRQAIDFLELLQVRFSDLLGEAARR